MGVVSGQYGNRSTRGRTAERRLHMILSMDDEKLLEQLSSKLGLNRTSVVRLAIRRLRDASQ